MDCLCLHVLITLQNSGTETRDFTDYCNSDIDLGCLILNYDFFLGRVHEFIKCPYRTTPPTFALSCTATVWSVASWETVGLRAADTSGCSVPNCTTSRVDSWINQLTPLTTLDWRRRGRERDDKLIMWSCFWFMDSPHLRFLVMISTNVSFLEYNYNTCTAN